MSESQPFSYEAQVFPGDHLRLYGAWKKGFGQIFAGVSVDAIRHKAKIINRFSLNVVFNLEIIFDYLAVHRVAATQLMRFVYLTYYMFKPETTVCRCSTK